jgi:hypothetical protein
MEASMTHKLSGIFETRPALLEHCRILISGVPLHEAPFRLTQPNWFWRLSDFPEKPVFFKRSDFVAAQMSPSNERLDDFFACTYFLMDAQESPHVPDKIRKHEVRLMFPRLGRKAIDVAFALASGRKRGRPRRN